MDCGHFYSRTHMSTRFDEQNCNSECSFCLTPDSLVLTADLHWVKLGDINEGDEIFAFDEFGHGRSSEKRAWKKGVVTHVHKDYQDVFDVELENGDHVKTTADHQWLAESRKAYKWVSTENMWIKGYNLYNKRKRGPHTGCTTTTVCKPIQVVFKDESYESGWIAGMLDADGHICQQNIHNPNGTIRYGFRVGIAQCEKYKDICEDVKKYLFRFTKNNRTCRQSMDERTHNILHSNYKAWQFLITGSNIEKIQFLMRVRPHKMKKVDIDKLGMVRSKYNTKVKSITPLGKQEIVVMETSTHTFIANGYMMHNCNRFSADHLIGYRENLIKKIGVQRFKLLEVKAHETKKWSCFELEQLIKYYKALGDKLSEEKGIDLK